MLSDGCLEIFKSQVKIFRITCSSPFKWKDNYVRNLRSKNNWQVYLTFSGKTRRHWTKWLLTHVFLWIYSIFLFCRLLYSLKMKYITEMKEIVAYCMWMFPYFIQAFSASTYIRSPDSICTLVNLTLNLWKITSNRKGSFKI